MRDLTKVILQMNSEIDAELGRFTRENRAEVSKKVMEPLRHFVEALSLFILIKVKNEPLNYNYERINEALRYIKNNTDTIFIYKFHQQLQASVSHYYEDENISERLMLKYYEYLIRIKKFFKSAYNLDILKNIYKFQVYQDPCFTDYYEIISKVIEATPREEKSLHGGERYYVEKIIPILVFNDIYYEITLSTVNTFATKYDRMTVYSKERINANYAVNIKFARKSIRVFNKRMPINVLTSWMVSIRPCEINHFRSIFGYSEEIQTGHNEYVNLMNFLTKYDVNLVDIINFDDSIYDNFRDTILVNVKTARIIPCLNACRQLINNNRDGANIISYLLLKMNNRIIKAQKYKEKNVELSGLYLKYGCIPFDKMPYCTSLIKHNPQKKDLMHCIDVSGHEHELLARKLQENVENNAQLYTPVEDLSEFDNLDLLIATYNSLLYRTHQGRKINRYHNYVFIQQYEDDILSIVKEFRQLSTVGIENYMDDFKFWHQSKGRNSIDNPEKLASLENLFAKTSIALIYGSAGTGKTYMINHIAELYEDSRILFLAETNAAVNNLIARIKAKDNFTFETIYQFNKYSLDYNYDIVIIDECSIVSNSNMRQIIEKAQYNQLSVVGDIFQIESIEFGTWFNIVRYFVPQYCITDLSITKRTDDEELLKVWKKVRNNEDDIQEYLDRNDFTADLDETLFIPQADDEIILCLNYDGLYGINNVNRFLQANNPNKAIYWGLWTYKIGDPIIFNESDRFERVIYNNLKGKIIDIQKGDLDIVFTIDVPICLDDYINNAYKHFEILDSSKEKSII